MNIQALDIKVGDCAVRTDRGDRIVAYCKQKMHILHGATVSGLTQNNITLNLSISVPYRESASCVVQFHREARVEMAGLKPRSKTRQQLLPPQEHTHV